jgi:hypothetical protein
MFCSKLHKRDGNTVLAVCDKEVLNKTFENDNMRFFVDPNFYGKDETPEENLKELFNDANIINLAGRRCVGLAVEMGYVDHDSVLEIKECSHAQVVRI